MEKRGEAFMPRRREVRRPEGAERAPEEGAVRREVPGEGRGEEGTRRGGTDP